MNEYKRYIKDIKMHLPPQITALIDLLEGSGYEAFVVGGAVRDLFIAGRIPYDYDITTNATPEQMCDVFRRLKVIPTGLKHGTLTVLSPPFAVEITTYRIDGDYLNHRTPKTVAFSSNLAEDLARRDFTMNALAYSDKIGVVDPYGGVEDVEKKLIRCVGDATKRFDEDALRILRGLRFSSSLKFQLDSSTQKAMKNKKENLRYISKERVQKELKGILFGDNAYTVLSENVEIIKVVFSLVDTSQLQTEAVPNFEIFKMFDSVKKTSNNELESEKSISDDVLDIIKEINTDEFDNDKNKHNNELGIGKEINSDEIVSDKNTSNALKHNEIEIQNVDENAKNGIIAGNKSIDIGGGESVGQRSNCAIFSPFLSACRKLGISYESVMENVKIKLYLDVFSSGGNSINDGCKILSKDYPQCQDWQFEYLKNYKFENNRASLISAMDIPPIFIAPTLISARKLLKELDTVSVITCLFYRFCYYSFYRAELSGDVVALLELVMDILQDNGECYRQSMLAVNGKDLKKLPIQTTRYGEYLNALLDAVIEEKLPNKKEPLLSYLESLLII